MRPKTLTETAKTLRRSRRAGDTDAMREAAVSAALSPWAGQKTTKHSRVEIGAALVAGKTPADIGGKNPHRRLIAEWVDGRLSLDIAANLESLRKTGVVLVYRSRKQVSDERLAAERAMRQRDREAAKATREEAKRAASARHLAKTIAWLQAKGYTVTPPDAK